MDKKIKELYKCERLKGKDPLVIWHNRVIEKREDELTISDVARCIRQNLFVETAAEMLLVYLLHDPYTGDVYGGELMEKARDIDIKYLLKHKDIVSEIIEKANEFIENNKWESDEEKHEYKESVDKLGEIISIKL